MSEYFENMSLNVSVKEEELQDIVSDDDVIVISYDPPDLVDRHSSRGSGRGSRSPEYRNVLRGVQDEKPYFRPKNNDGNIQVRYPSSIDGYMNDNSALAQMESLGLPLSDSTQWPTKRREKRKHSTAILASLS